MISENVQLKKYNTFGLDCKSRYFISVNTEEEAVSLTRKGSQLKKPVLVLGGGSNLLFTGDFPGTIILCLIGGIKVEKIEEKHVLVSAGAGVVWDEFVAWCVERGYGGAENLSLIPGTVGAAPVQNIGAYGAEAKDIIMKVRALSLADGTETELDNEECRFGYRTSIFKTAYRRQLLVTRVFFRLSTAPVVNLSYGALASETEAIGAATIANVREAVIRIRRSKLPDPEETGNAGSFFKNPVVSQAVASKLKAEYPGIPCYNDPSGGIKLAAGWLIEQCGWKGKKTGSAGVYPKQALVLVNYGGATGEEIYNLSEEIRQSVFDKFSVAIESEVEVIRPI